MRVPWKLVGLAGVAGVAATGAVVVRRRRSTQDYDPDALRSKLHDRLDATRMAADGAPPTADGGAPRVVDGPRPADPPPAAP